MKQFTDKISSIKITRARIGIYETPLRSILIPYRKLADVIENSGFEYTILRPDWFTNGNEVIYALTHKGEPETGAAFLGKVLQPLLRRLLKPQNYIKMKIWALVDPNNMSALHTTYYWRS